MRATLVESPDAASETVNTVLASRARERSFTELRMSALGGSANAILLWTQFPSLHWLAGAFAALAAYGVWGLLDRSLTVIDIQDTQPPEARRFVRIIRGAIGVSGWVAALYAVLGFLTSFLGPLSLPGR